MNQQMFDAFFATKYVNAGEGIDAPEKRHNKRDLRSLTKGNWRTRYLFCKRCGETIAPANNFTEEEMMGWDGVEKHIATKHDEREITLMLLGWTGDWEDME